MVSRSIKKLFSIDGVNIYLKIFFNRFCPVEKCGATPRCVYLDSLPYASQIHLKAIDKYFHLRLVFSSPTVSFVYLEDKKGKLNLLGILTDMSIVKPVLMLSSEKRYINAYKSDSESHRCLGSARLTTICKCYTENDIFKTF